VTNVIHVAVAVIINTNKEVLLALRQSHQHQGNLWEFPGGKVESNEQVYNALVREIDEEIGLTISSAHALVKINHDYCDKAVLLDVWFVDEFSGQAQGREGQQLRWCAVSNLRENDFPAANVAIIHAIKSELL
jgi:8-oxo-dGTP diphosphatase